MMTALPKTFTLGAITLSFAHLTASATTVLPTDPFWASIGNSGGGSSAITSTEPRSGNGSLELRGDRTRFTGLGNPFDSSSNLGLLSSVTDFTFEWNIATDSSALLDPDYTPALRLHVFDAGQFSELIWEGVYNGTYGATTKGTWYASGSDDNFWQWITGVGATTIYDRSISDWQSLYSPSAIVTAVSVGVGGSAGSAYHAFADNVTLGINGSTVTYNFEVAGSSAVPDGGASLGLLGLASLGLLGLRKKLQRG